MMLSSLILAKAIEESKIHQRLALKMLFHIGTSVHKVLFGLMMTTMFLSFCISSSAATAMVSSMETAFSLVFFSINCYRTVNVTVSNRRLLNRTVKVFQ